MALVSFKDISMAFGGPPLLDGVSMQIEEGERVCLVGRNGAGKTTLLKILAGKHRPDSGEIFRRPGLTVAGLPQDVPAGMDGTVYEAVAAGLGAAGEKLAEYHQLTASLTDRDDPETLQRMDRLQLELEALGGWESRRKVETILTRMKLPPEFQCQTLSAGASRRVLLARALVAEPDMLLLDEPTNHLDIESIGWLEEYLAKFRGAILFVTHDRMFIRHLATRILEIDRGRLSDWNCGYEEYLQKRQAVLEAEAEQQARFDKKMTEEEAWLQKGIRARRTRNEGRVRALLGMREQRAARREQMGRVGLEVQEAERSGKLVVEARNISFAYEGRTVIRNCSTTVIRGDKVGIIGPNGSGKTTLLRLLLGELKPFEGTVREGVRLEAAYFDQLRAQLDEDKTVQENVGDGKENLTINGRERHIIGYLKDFLFTPERARTPVRALSGGERNRLLLAKLFTRPANVLVLDEPTNDLDAETLDILEELLLEFTGTILLVSHDREFLNNLVTSTLVLANDGRVAEYVGGYDDYLRQHQALAENSAGQAQPKARKPKPKQERPRKITFKEQRELEELPARIEALEKEQAELYAAMGAPSFYQQPGEAITAARDRLKAVEAALPEAYDRWAELEELRDMSKPETC